MSREVLDAVVVGLGAMGSAATYQLAKAGARVVALDQYRPPHDRGSTHGDTRITRLGIGEGPEYVPLVKRSHEIWREVEAQTGLQLLSECGGLVMTGPGHTDLHERRDFLRTTVVSARQHGVAHEILTGEQVRARFPQFALTGLESAYYEPTAGYVRPELCVEAQLSIARRHGADLRTGERVVSYRDGGDAVSVTTERETLLARKVIVASGPWVTELVPELASRVRVLRQVMFWFDLADRSLYDEHRAMPVYIWQFGGVDAGRFVYGFPMVDGPSGGAKIATEQYVDTTTAAERQRPASQEEVDAMYDGYVRERLPGLGRRCVKTATCLYTVLPGSRFLIDAHPAAPNVIVASPCSGHGFKHSAAIGEALAQLVAHGASDVDLAPFAWR